MNEGQARALGSLVQGVDSELAGKIETVLERGPPTKTRLT